MLFIIDESVSALFGAGRATPADIEGLNNLAQGVAEGNHRLVASRSVLQVLTGQSELSIKTKSVLNRSLGRIAQEGRLHQKLGCYGRVIASTGTSISSTTIKAQRIVTIPLPWFDNSAKIQPTILLGEHLVDAMVFSRIGETGSTTAGLPYLPLKATPTLGGGSATGVVLGSIASRDQLCLCIVDSDRASPTGTLGDTAMGVQGFKQIAKYPLIEVAETVGRDLENSLPDSFYLNVYGSKNRKTSIHTLLKQTAKAGNLDIRFHLDIEKGLLLRKIFEHAVGTPERIFWDMNLPIAMSLMGLSASAFPCLPLGICQSVPCTCAVALGNPANILEAFLKWSNPDRYILAQELDSAVRSEWQRLGLLIASWCLGDDRLRI